jgi:hypothetical protein
VAWGVVAAIRPPGADTELFVFLPAIEGCQAEVQDDNTLSTADVVEQRRFSAFAPPELGLVGIVVAEDDHVVRGEHFGPCPSELLGDANLDAAGVFKDLAKGGSSATPVMARRVLASDDEGLELRSVNVFRAPPKRRNGLRLAESQKGYTQQHRPVFHFSDIATYEELAYTRCSCPFGKRYAVTRG